MWMISRFTFGEKNKEVPEVKMKAFEKLQGAVTKAGRMLSLNERGRKKGER